MRATAEFPLLIFFLDGNLASGWFLKHAAKPAAIAEELELLEKNLADLG